MNKVIKSLLLAAAFMVPAQKVSASIDPRDCDAIVRMGLGVLVGAGFYKLIEDAAIRLWDFESVPAEAPNYSVLVEYSEDMDGNQTMVDLAHPKKTLAQKLLKVAKNCGKTALVLALGYAIAYNSLTDLLLTSSYDILNADIQSSLRSYKNPSMVVADQGAAVIHVPVNTNIVLPGCRMTAAIIH